MPFKSFMLLPVVMLLTACITNPPAPTAPPAPARPVEVISPAKQQLTRGIKSYDDGDLKTAAVTIESALGLGLSSKADQTAAHKHLAFIHCASKRTTQCRSEFKKALEADPTFNLLPEEAGHPLWGAVFKSEKAKYSK